jgi:transposase InsO family protein
MDPELVAAVARVAAGGRVNVARVCRQRQVSRTTFYHYLDRFRREGAAGFIPRSRAPRSRPGAMPGRVREAVIRARKELDDEGRDNGPISIGWRLEDDGFQPLPSRSTIYRILRDAGQIVAQPQKAPRASRRFEFADPNGCWQVDGLDYTLTDGQVVCILQILDDHSRLDVCCFAAASENGQDAQRAFERAFAGYGCPVCVLSDNSRAFSGRLRGGMAALERFLAARGITAITASRAHPQTCGKNERAHQTLQKWLAKQPTAATLAQLQGLLDSYRLMYNNRRHQGIGGATPQQRFDARDKACSSARPRAAGRATRPISTTGVVAFDGCSIILGRRWAGATATLYWQHDRVAVMVDDQLVRILTLNRTTRYQPRTPTEGRAGSTG